jgi:hypothetical protein
MPTYEVEVTRSITTTVSVEADSAEAAVSKVAKHDFPLPERDEWNGMKDWFFRATNTNDDADTHSVG